MAEPTDSVEGPESAVRPLYARLPRGPHRMEPGEVAENQRQRMHGAMVEAVAAHGYGGTSVKQVISLAGVSRRAFYEQFSNKQECFLSTLELVANRAGECVSGAYRSTEGGLEPRLRSSLRTLTELIASNPKSAQMALLEAPAAGAPGWGRLTRTLLAFERMLGASFACTPGATALPAPVARGIVGGLHRVVFARVAQQRADELPELAEEMLSWTLTFNSPALARLDGDAGRLRGGGGLERAGRPPAVGVAHERTGEIGPAPAERAAYGAHRPLGCEHERVRLLESALEMVALEGYGNLSPLRIVDRAGTSIDTFFSLFGDMEGCVLVALANLSEEVRETLAAVDLRAGEDWPSGVRQALHALMHHFAAHPSHAHMVATGVFEMGSPGVDLSLELAGEVARTLLAGAPPAAGGSGLAVDGTAGAIWHTLYCHAAYHKTDRLPASADHLTYVALAPFLGAEQAVEALAPERQGRRFARRSQHVQRTGERRGSPAAL